MTNYVQLLYDFNTYIDKLCSDVENISDNEDAKNILDITTTEWGLVKTLISHFDDPGAGLLGADRLARLTACIAIAEAKD